MEKVHIQMTHECCSKSKAIPFLTSYGFEYLTLFNKVCGLYRHLKVNSSFMPKNLAKTGPKVKISSGTRYKTRVLLTTKCHAHLRKRVKKSTRFFGWN